MPGNLEAMELYQLAAKQKRARDWQRFIEESEISDKPIITQTKAYLAEYRSALSQAAQAGAISTELKGKILDLERKLEQLNEEARLTP